jgi:OHCU decarboxylase
MGRQLDLIRAHPDLAGKAAIAGELTDDSETEQASAGLDSCSPDEYARFKALNDEYRSKFGFPFVMAVRNKSRKEILEAFETRLENDYDEELENALLEIHRIARMRLIALGAN